MILISIKFGQFYCFATPLGIKSPSWNLFALCFPDELLMSFLTIFINPPHPFSIDLNRFWYFTQDLLRTIELLENNRKQVWYVYKQHNNLVVALVFEIQDLALYAPGLEFQYKTSHSVIILYLKLIYIFYIIEIFIITIPESETN